MTTDTMPRPSTHTDTMPRPSTREAGTRSRTRNDLVAKAEDSENIWTGSRLLEDGADLKEAFESNSWVSGGLATASTVADTAAAVMDPPGEALSAGVGWLIEHLSPLKDWLNELTGDSDAVTAAASTWTNIGTELSLCADDLDRVCSSRLAGQESVAVAAFKSLQAGSAAHLRMTGQLAGAISGGLTVASVIVRMVHDLVRDAIADVVGKLASKVTIGVLTAGLAAPWAVSSAVTEVSSWATRLSKEVTDVVTSSKNLKLLLEKAKKLFSWVAEKFKSKAKDGKSADEATEAATNPLGEQTVLAGPGGQNVTMRQANEMGKANPRVYVGKGPQTPIDKSYYEGRYGVKLDKSPPEPTSKPTAGGGEDTPPKGDGDGSDPMSGPVVFYPPKNATAAEIKEVDDYVAGCNRALEADALSPTGRVATTGTRLGTEAKYAAKLERMRHPELYRDGKVAGHVPDTGWGRGPEPHEWQPMSRKVNSSLGGQNKRYPVGFKPTIFLRGEWE
ncbi:Uncharacterised protein [Actinomyces viscosus]|uniref:Uncharacterized protein n=1 Tax=Actinomyces viscosus TaxID=1656 RepID=A0A448PNH3_ACTVI|nr:Uncharacterised protein [Actinomyces viscosus]